MLFSPQFGNCGDFVIVPIRTSTYPFWLLVEHDLEVTRNQERKREPHKKIAICYWGGGGSQSDEYIDNSEYFKQ